MTDKREVWVHGEATLTIWEEDATGDIVAEESPVRSNSCFYQSVRVTRVRWTSEKQVPGIAHEVRRSRVIGHEIRMDALYERAAEQITSFLEDGKKYRIRIAFENPRYSGVAPFENDTHEFTGCTPIEGPDFGYQDNSEAETGLAFFAEGMV